MKNYEDIVMQHYTKVAEEDGDKSSSTMKNIFVREKETGAIITIINYFISNYKNDNIKILDIGCGNGYTLSILEKKFINCTLYGIEKNNNLREIAFKRFINTNTKIIRGDILNPLTTQIDFEPDIIISQRVLINLLDEEDQIAAALNMINCLSVGGIIIFIESLKEPLRTLNAARAEFTLKPILESDHNLYLSNTVINMIENKLTRIIDSNIPEENFLSSYYYISRVLHDIALNGKPFMRNSHFVNFFANFIPGNIGNYSPLKILVFKKTS